jgi:peptide/nickel transport system ATP-binding protein
MSEDRWLRARELSVRVDGHERVSNLDFDLGPAGALGVAGPSGAGKSTLARALVGLHPLSGSLRWGDRDLVQDPAAWKATRQQIHLVWQDARAALDPRMRVGALVDHARALAGHPPLTEGPRRALLESLGLAPSLASRRPGELSGGQCQRVGLCRAFAAQPGVLILDEPTANVDRPLAWELHELLGQRRRSGLRLLVITHDLAWLRGLVDELLIMDEGRVVERGEPSRVLAAPRHATTRALVQALPGSPSSPAPPRTHLEQPGADIEDELGRDLGQGRGSDEGLRREAPSSGADA